SGISALAWRTGVVGRPAWANQAWGRPTATPYPVDFARPETIPDPLCKTETIPDPSLGCHTHCRPLPRLSHALRLARLTGMRTERAVLAGIVLIHLILSMIHGSAHAGARVALPVAGTLFVYLVILAGPLVGLALSWWRPQAGAALVAVTMAGSFVFG